MTKALRDKEFAIAEAHRERDNAVEEAQAAIDRREVADGATRSFATRRSAPQVRDGEVDLHRRRGDGED